MRAVLDLFFPALCPRCDRSDGPGLCVACQAQLEVIMRPCPHCAAPRLGSSCEACQGKGLSGLSTITATWRYAGAMAEIITAAKAGHDLAACRALAQLLPEPGYPIDAVIPIPAAPGRNAGPKLPLELARQAARVHHAPLLRILGLRALPAQQHALDAAARQRNVSELFVCRRSAPQQVLLIDDILTSGATLQAAAKALRTAGARVIHALCLARTPRGDDARAADSSVAPV
ncbi:MAG: phosphoribosyltransferase family protein [Planctomycetota bacterium]|jgi:predicted amidophosphoribosyltransferase|nr:phosphoribosyltransferase family protein [Planctomycetota bacterium]